MFSDDLSLAAILSNAGCREEAANTVSIDGRFVLAGPPESPHAATTKSPAEARAFLITGEILSPAWPTPRGPTLLPASSHPRPADVAPRYEAVFTSTTQPVNGLSYARPR